MFDSLAISAWLGFTSAHVHFLDQHFSVIALLNRNYEVDAQKLAFNIPAVYLQQTGKVLKRKT